MAGPGIGPGGGAAASVPLAELNELTVDDCPDPAAVPLGAVRGGVGAAGAFLASTFFFSVCSCCMSSEIAAEGLLGLAGAGWPTEGCNCKGAGRCDAIVALRELMGDPLAAVGEDTEPPVPFGILFEAESGARGVPWGVCTPVPGADGRGDIAGDAEPGLSMLFRINIDRRSARRGSAGVGPP